MTTIGLDDTDMEFNDYDDESEGELWDESESEGYDDESQSARDHRRRRPLTSQQLSVLAARQRRQAVVRLRQQAGLPTRIGGALRPVPPKRVSPQQAVKAIRDISLDTKVQEDAVRRAITVRDKRMKRQELVTVASLVASQITETFSFPKDPIARAALRAAPLILMSPQRRGTGAEGILKDPRFVGTGLVMAIALAGRTDRFRFNKPAKIKLTPPPALAAGKSSSFIADVFDRGNEQLKDAEVKWESSDTAVATVDPQTTASGTKTSVTVVAGTKVESVTISATTADGRVVERATLKIS